MKTTHTPYQGFAQVHLRNGDIEPYGIIKSPYETWETKHYVHLGESFVNKYGLVSRVVFLNHLLEHSFTFIPGYHHGWDKVES